MMLIPNESEVLQIDAFLVSDRSIIACSLKVSSSSTSLKLIVDNFPTHTHPRSRSFVSLP